MGDTSGGGYFILMGGISELCTWLKKEMTGIQTFLLETEKVMKEYM